jgi:hypothetical protein
MHEPLDGGGMQAAITVLLSSGLVSLFFLATQRRASIQIAAHVYAAVYS